MVYFYAEEEEVAKLADDFFDRNGKPTEKSTTPINHVTSAPSTAAIAPSTAPAAPSAR